MFNLVMTILISYMAGFVSGGIIVALAILSWVHNKKKKKEEVTY